MGSHIWWSYTWRAMLLTIAVSAFTGLISGLLQVTAGFKLPDTLNTLIGAVAGVIIAFKVIKILLQKRYRDFRVAVIPHAPSAEAEEEQSA